MSLENLLSLQIEGKKIIGEPQSPRPSGVGQGSVLVILDANKNIAPTALYWALGNVIRKGDSLKIVGIISQIVNAMGFMSRIDLNSWNGSNGLELQHEIATKKEAIENIPYLREWCAKAGVKMAVDVKAGFQPKLIAIDEAKSIGAYHVVLDKNMKKDKKFFVENLTCFVSRATSSGGVETVRTFPVSNKLPPMVPTTPNKGQSIPFSKVSVGSAHSIRGSSMSSTTFEFGYADSSDEFNTQDSDLTSGPSTGESIDRPEQEIMLRAPPLLSAPPTKRNTLNNLLRAPILEAEPGYKLINPLRKPALRKWLSEDERTEMPGFFEQTSLSPRTGGARLMHYPVGTAGWSGQWSVAPEIGQQNIQLGRPQLTASLQTQASFHRGRKHQRPEKINMDVYWPIMEWAECRALRQRYNSSGNLVGGGNMDRVNARASKLLGVRRKIAAVSLNYGDMVDSD